MECLGKRVCDESVQKLLAQKLFWQEKAAKETLLELSVEEPSREIYREVLKNWDRMAKPLDSLGCFEKITAQIGAASGTDRPDISRKAVIIMCADNGIVKEGVSQSGQEVTAAVARQMARGESSVGKMAAVIGADTIAVDIGINREEKIAGLLDRRISRGTRNFCKEPAMTEEEAVRAIYTGMELVADCREKGYGILATGEMGIGNTTTSSAITAALLACSAAEVTGRGAGLSDEKFMRKQQVIEEAVARYRLRGAEPLEILQCVGGLDLAGLAGVCIGGAVFHMPIVLDGFISMTAALLAERIIPGTASYLVASHKGKEPAVGRLAAELGLNPVIDAGMALGEGTGAVMMLSLLDMAFRIYNEGTTFLDMEMEPYRRNQ